MAHVAKPFLMEYNDPVYYIVNTMTVNDLLTQGDSASVAMVLV